MTIPVCRVLDEIPDPSVITLPGGVTIERINLMEVMGPLLAPLAPFFNIIDTVVAIFNCIKAIATLNPKTIAECFPDLGEAVGKLLAMHPMVALPLLIVQVIDLLIATLYQARGELMHLQRQAEQINRSIDRAAELNDPESDGHCPVRTGQCGPGGGQCGQIPGQHGQTHRAHQPVSGNHWCSGDTGVFRHVRASFGCHD